MAAAKPKHDPLDSLLKPLLEPLHERIDHELHADPFQRDPRVVASTVPLLKLVTGYYNSEVRGWENLPKKGPMLIVGNHSGGAETNDLAYLLHRWIEERGVEEPLYSLAYDLLFTYPVWGRRMRKLGIIPANPKNARAALERGSAIVVFPGGDYEVFRPWSERNRIEFGGHVGFVKLALETGVPVVPMTIHGAHQSTVVLTRGRRIARAIGLDKLHIQVFPFIWNIPFGITPASVPSLPLPSKVTVHLDPPLDWSRFGAKGSRNRKVVRQCYDEITTVMQTRMDALAREHPYPVLTRLNDLRPSQLILRGVRSLFASGAPKPDQARKRPKTRPAPKRSRTPARADRKSKRRGAPTGSRKRGKKADR